MNIYTLSAYLIKSSIKMFLELPLLTRCGISLEELDRCHCVLKISRRTKIVLLVVQKLIILAVMSMMNIQCGRCKETMPCSLKVVPSWRLDLKTEMVKV